MNEFWEGFREGFDRSFIPVAILALIIGLLWTEPTPAQESHHPQEHIDLHNKFYSTWMRPDMRLPNGQRQYSCCDLRDCAPARFKQENGRWIGQKIGIPDDQTWYRVPDEIFESEQPDPRESPDGLPHLCARTRYTIPFVFCAVLGSGT